MEAREELEHDPLLRVVETGRRLVEDQHARRHREHGRDGEALPFAFAKEKGILVALPAEADRQKRLVDARRERVAGEPEVARPERHLVGDRRREELMIGILEDVADLACDPLERKRAEVGAVETDVTGLGLEEPVQVLRERRLAESRSGR
jgi:hypothetical protein